MRVNYIISTLPAIWAGPITFMTSKHNLERDGSNRAPEQVDICGTETMYTFPACASDSDCQKPGSKLSNLPASGVQIEDLLFQYGDGYCDTNTKTCASVINPDDDLKGYCLALMAIYGTKVQGLSLLNQCINPNNRGVVDCDFHCDPKINPACGTTTTYNFPCLNATVGGPNGNGPLKCAGALSVPGATDNTRPGPVSL